MKKIKHRSGSPVSSALDILGDKWSLLIIWDMIVKGKNTYNELLKSDEKIATNILANRLAMLEAEGLITKQEHPDSKAKILYSLTNKAIELLPVLVEMLLWANNWLPVQPGAENYITQLKKNKVAFVKRVMEDMKKKVGN